MSSCGFNFTLKAKGSRRNVLNGGLMWSDCKHHPACTDGHRLKAGHSESQEVASIRVPVPSKEVRMLLAYLEGKNIDFGDRCMW